MKRLKVFCLMMLAVSAVGFGLAGSAVAALPEVLLLSGETGSLLLNSLTNTFVTSLETIESNAIKGKGVLVQLHFPNVNSNLGTYELLFLKVTYNGTACTSNGDNPEEVLLPKGTFHLVYDSLTVLGVAALFLVPEFKFPCKTGATTTVLVVTLGNQLVLVFPVGSEVLTSEEVRSTSLCNKGKPLDTKWWNDNGTVLTARLEANVGAGFVTACENVEGTVFLTVSRMAEVMG
jgi:hypothetical protein